MSDSANILYLLALWNIYYCYKTHCHARNIHQYMHLHQFSIFIPQIQNEVYSQ